MGEKVHWSTIWKSLDTHLFEIVACEMEYFGSQGVALLQFMYRRSETRVVSNLISMHGWSYQPPLNMKDILRGDCH